MKWFGRKLDDLDNEFLHNLLEDYRIMLNKEYDYLTSCEAIVESIDANGDMSRRKREFSLTDRFSISACYGRCIELDSSSQTKDRR